MFMPIRKSFPYTLQVQVESNWVPICYYDEDHLREALASCRRAVLVEKFTSRVIERSFSPDGPIHNVVLELFYNRDEDPEAWEDDDDYEDEGFEISWKDYGF